MASSKGKVNSYLPLVSWCECTLVLVQSECVYHGRAAYGSKRGSQYTLVSKDSALAILVLQRNLNVFCFLPIAYTTILANTDHYDTKEKKNCRNPGSNQGPLDLQSNALPTELFRPHHLLLDVRSKSLFSKCRRFL